MGQSFGSLSESDFFVENVAAPSSQSDADDSQDSAKDKTQDRYMSTAAMCFVLACVPDIRQVRKPIKQLDEAALEVVCAKCTELQSTKQRTEITQAPGQNFQLVVEPTGVVSGFQAILDVVNPKVRGIWAMSQATRGFPSVTLSRIFGFMHGLGGNATAASRTILRQVRAGCSISVGRMLDEYFDSMYKPVHGFGSLPRVLRSASGRLTGSGIDADSAWSVLESAREVARVSPGAIIDVRNDDEDGPLQGMSPTNGSNWSRQELNMVLDKCAVTFKDCSKFCLYADPSVFSTEDTMVGQVYAWEVKMIAAGLIQVICPYGNISPDSLHGASEDTKVGIRFETKKKLGREKNITLKINSKTYQKPRS